MANAGTYRIPVRLLVALWVLVSVPGGAQVKKEVRFTVGQKPVISITNNYGPITVKPSGTNQVVVTIVSYSDEVSFVNEQHGTRIELRAESKRAGKDLAEYSVLAPAASTLILQSLDGALYAQGLQGDAVLEGASAIAEVSDAADAHIHIKTLSGSARLTNIRHSRLYISSVTGNIDVRNVTESLIEAHSASGRITYAGDPGISGEYKLTSHSGDLDVSVPAGAIVQIDAHSFTGIGDPPTTSDTTQGSSQGNRFLKPGPMRSGSRFVLRSFRGKIHLNRP
jgi:Putative adhesin